VAGLLFLLFPFLFILGVLLEMYLNVHGSAYSIPCHWVTEVAPDSDASPISWMIRFLLVGAPVLVLALNLLAITGLWYQIQPKVLHVSVELKWLNIMLPLFYGLVVPSFPIYGIAENL
jgi:hypothetical protein